MVNCSTESGGGKSGGAQLCKEWGDDTGRSGGKGGERVESE